MIPQRWVPDTHVRKLICVSGISLQPGPAQLAGAGILGNVLVVYWSPEFQNIKKERDRQEGKKEEREGFLAPVSALAIAVT